MAGASPRLQLEQDCRDVIRLTPAAIAPLRSSPEQPKRWPTMAKARSTAPRWRAGPQLQRGGRDRVLERRALRDKQPGADFSEAGTERMVGGEGTF